MGTERGGRFNITVVFPENGKQCLLLRPKFQWAFSNGISTCVSQWCYLFNMANQWYITGNPHFQSSAAGNRNAPSGKSRRNETICHILRLDHETIVCLFIFLWICDMVVLLRGTYMSWWFLPRTWYPVTDIQHYYLARYPTDDWHTAHMFSQVYFSWLCVWEGCVTILLAHG